jgi:cell division topological specificity factor
VICKYVEIDTDRVEVKLESNGDISMLEVNIELPGQASVSVHASA